MNNRVSWIDGIKGIAICLIICIHFENWMNISHNNVLLKSFISKGCLGVELTYVVNAFLLFCKYKKNNSNLQIVINSFLRILPIYYLGVSVLFFLVFVGGINSSFNIFTIVSQYLFVAWISPFSWNALPGIGYMHVLFVLWFFLYFYSKLINNLQQSLIGFSIIFSICTILYILLNKINPINDYLLWNEYFSYFLRGITSFSLAPILFYINENIKNRDRKMGVLCYLFSFCYIFLLIVNKCENNTLYIVPIFILFLGSLFYDFFQRLNFIRFIGKHIFGLYFGHIIFYYIFVNVINNKILLAVVVLFAALFFSILMEDFVQKKYIRLIKLYAEKKETKKETN